MTPRLPFPDRLQELWPQAEWGPCGVVVAVSGGADSVALLRALHACADSYRNALCVAHLDHQLRGPEGEDDARFVGRLADELGLERRIESFDVAAVQQGGEGREAAARRIRYQFLQRVAEDRGARYVAVAHTADDQAETVLQQLFRGAGLQGLSGMTRARRLGQAVTLLRPLLEFRRQELRDYLTSIGQPWREDSSNADPDLTRNRLRQRLLPLLEAEFGPDVVSAICRAASLASEAQQVIADAAAGLFESAAIHIQPSVVILVVKQLEQTPPIVVGEVLRLVWRKHRWPQRDMSFADWRSLADALRTPGDLPARMLPGGIRAVKKGDQLWLTRPYIGGDACEA